MLDWDFVEQQRQKAVDSGFKEVVRKVADLDGLRYWTEMLQWT